MPRKKQPKQKSRRSYDDDFKAEAVQMLLDGHSAQSIVERLGISGTNLLYRWKKQQLEEARLKQIMKPFDQYAVAHDSPGYRPKPKKAKRKNK